MYTHIICIYYFWKKLSGQKLPEIIGLRFCLRFWLGILRFCLRFPICTAFVCCLLLRVRVRCMATGSYWFSIRFSDMLVAAAGSSWLLKPFSAYVRLTFCLRFSYVKNGPYETLRKLLFGQWQCETHKEAHWFSKARCLSSKYNTTPASCPVRIGPCTPDQKQ